MDIFLTSESYAPASTYWRPMCREFGKKLEHLKEFNYGDELKSIGIVTILLPESFFEDGGYKERSLFKRSTKEADLRLRIDYKAFIKADDAERRQMYLDHIMQALNTLRGKVSRDFALDALINDVYNSIKE